ncbi:hypothetical protein H9Q69_011700 [Fusarium xylarioides]|uniref:Uncharacterized protein n=1 Tax=Fusarium xylarioides TaxID=221167 RepID=A0A9P7IAP4_9HYPO|nr:hypothetical protein H9Q72_001330 [Fusarium xylarioides]KAG5789243.1 hypothetical protein H9Q69_011700 [Fusarium xylarioides]KAG5806422.1 hypothetical protein H9Q71_008998 [Fusarium xylarioides]KAG5820753.1 hypothetical protein H9Q74_008696 [Fusarium xylarioides]
MNRRLKQLYSLGVLRVRLEADKDGYPTFVAMPDAPLKLLVPTNYDRRSLLVTLKQLFTVGEGDIVTDTVTAVDVARSEISRDLTLMDDFLAKSTTSATAQELADGDTLATYPQAMARIIRYDGNILGAMAQAKADEVRAYAWTNVTRAAEQVKKLLEWQLNADLSSAMNEAMNGFDSPADEEVRSEQEVN